MASDPIIHAYTIFQQPWWLDVVAPSAWDAVEIKKGNEVVARLPYVIRRRLGMTFLTMASLTKLLGPWLRPSDAKPARQLEQQKELLTQLIDQLPDYDLFSQNFHYSVTNWLPFYWHDFRQTTRYTYVLDSQDDIDCVWAQFDGRARTAIRKAEKHVSVRTDLGIERFLDLNALTFQRQGRQLPYTREFVCGLDAACAEHQARRIYFAEDADGRCHAAVYIVWDDRSVYYLMGGTDPAFRNSDATSLLLWHAIQFATATGKRFDFEGSMVEPLERFFRGFGAKQTPYFRIRRMSRRMRVLMAGRDAVSALLGRGVTGH